ncbi:MAG: HNH endonuclease [Candidatus Pacearchaeota archaeon]
MPKSLFEIGNLKKVIPRKRDTIRMIGGHVREPVSAKKRRQLMERAKNKCEWKGCNHNKHLQVHHLNMKNDDNRISNLKILCPNHHADIHDKFKRKVKRDVLGRVIHGRVVENKLKDKTKKRKRRSQGLNGMIKLNMKSIKI